MKHLYRLGLWLARKCQPKVETSKEAVMAYTHPELIRRLVEKYEMTHERAVAAFEGVKYYLFICGSTGGNFSPPNNDVDEAWHNFMLFSKDYMRFCLTNFGFYIHHQPFTAAESQKALSEVCCNPNGKACCEGDTTGCKSGRATHHNTILAAQA